MAENARGDKMKYSLERDGITQSLLSLFLTCREKARLYLQGWNSKYCSPALMYGSLGHGMLEHAYLDISSRKLKGIPSEQQIRKYSAIVEKQWLAENPKPKTETLVLLETSLALLEVTLPRYFDFWKKDFTKIQWQALEEQFCVEAQPMKGVKIKVRGKQDGRFKVRNESWILETKTKSMVNESDLIEALPIDLQVNLYAWAAYIRSKKCPDGVLYNIIRKTALRIGVHESIPKFMKKVAKDMDKRPDFYFVRMEIPILKKEILQFEMELYSMLRDFHTWWNGGLHYKNPNNCISKYGRCEYIGICSNGDYSAVAKRDRIFKELNDF
jgi:hypothetical protein